MRLPTPLLLAFALLFLAVPVQAACTEGDVRDCTTAEGCDGNQECVSNTWTECALDGNTCAPGEAESCAPLVNGIECPLVDGLRLCSECGDSWTECVALTDAECCPGQTQQCEGSIECEGTQVCEDGNWGECKFEEICDSRSKRECIPVINDEECPAVEGTQTCNLCGSAWRECSPGKAKCCPGQARACDGNGSQECEDDGKWGSCFDGESCQAKICTSDNNCMVSRCAMGKCVEERIPGCCNTDADCDSVEKCGDGNCAELECGECFFAREHLCYQRREKDGACCNGHWNYKYGSCTLDFVGIEELVDATDDARAVILFEKGLAAMDEGLLERAEGYFGAAEFSITVYKSRNDYNDAVMALIDLGFLGIAEALAQNDTRLAEGREEAVEELLLLKKPRLPSDSNRGGSDDYIGPPPETPWLLVVGLAVAVVFLLLLLVLELSKRKKGFFSIGKKQQNK